MLNKFYQECFDMTPREITSAMHHLFPGELPGNEDWHHLMKDGEFSVHACAKLIDDYISDDCLLIFADSRHAVVSSKRNAPDIIKTFIKIRKVKVANRSFRSKIIIETIGVGKGSNENM